MELITSIRKAIDYMEKHLTDNISAQDVADQVYLSPFKDFSSLVYQSTGSRRYPNGIQGNNNVSVQGNRISERI